MTWMYIFLGISKRYSEFSFQFLARPRNLFQVKASYRNMNKVAPTDKNVTFVGPATGVIDNCNGLKLHCKYWFPNGNKEIRGLVFLCHGLAEHLQWYGELALQLNDAGLLAFGHDHMGHGLSEGKRSQVNEREEYVKAVISHCEKMKQQYSGKPCFIVGHSMGGMIALCAMLAQPELFRGAVLMGPLIKADETEATPVKVFLAKIIAKLFPNLVVAKIDLSYVTRDEEMKLKLKSDPLRYHGGIRAQLGVVLHDTLLYVNTELENVTTPFLIIHGEKDKLCAIQGSQDLYKRSRSKDKDMKTFYEAHHHLYLEIPKVRQEALHDTVEWIKNRINMKTPSEK